MDFGWYGDRDIGGAVTFLTDQPDVDPSRIAAVGLSMGGEEAIGAAATNDAIKAVVAEGATNRVAADKAWLSDEYGARGALSEALEAMTYGFADLLTTAGPPVSLHDAVRAAAPRPVLLITAGDVADEARAGRYIQSASPATVTLWDVPGTSHTHGLRTHPDEWEHRVVTFLDDALGRADGGNRRPPPR
jgi:dienelactone hydrolase